MYNSGDFQVTYSGDAHYAAQTWDMAQLASGQTAKPSSPAAVWDPDASPALNGSPPAAPVTISHPVSKVPVVVTSGDPGGLPTQETTIDNI